MRRDVDGGRREDAHVGDEPLDPVLRQQADAVPRCNPGLDQGRGTGQGVGAVALPAQVAVQAMLLVAQGGARSETLGLTAVQFRQITESHGSSPLNGGRHTDTPQYCSDRYDTGACRRGLL